jgi:hypothetical protein
MSSRVVALWRPHGFEINPKDRGWILRATTNIIAASCRRYVAPMRRVVNPDTLSERTVGIHGAVAVPVGNSLWVTTLPNSVERIYKRFNEFITSVETSDEDVELIWRYSGDVRHFPYLRGFDGLLATIRALNGGGYVSSTKFIIAREGLYIHPEGAAWVRLPTNW